MEIIIVNNFTYKVLKMENGTTEIQGFKIHVMEKLHVKRYLENNELEKIINFFSICIWNWIITISDVYQIFRFFIIHL